MTTVRKPHKKDVRAKALKIMVEGGSANDVHVQLAIPLSTAQSWMRDYKVDRFQIAPMRAHHSEKDRQRALLLFREGKGYKATAKELALPVYTVRDWHREFANGMFEPERKNVSNREALKSKELHEAVVALSDAGRSHNEIVKLTGVRLQTVRSWLRRVQNV